VRNKLPVPVLPNLVTELEELKEENKELKKKLKQIYDFCKDTLENEPACEEGHWICKKILEIIKGKVSK